MSDGPEVVFTKCPIHPCKLIVPEEIFKELLDPEHNLKYQEYYKNTFIGMNKRTKWCPAPECGRAVDYPSMKQTDIVCKCGQDWCFKCLRGAHRPVPCDLLHKWLDQTNLGSDANEQWIKLNTKDCPKCKSKI